MPPVLNPRRPRLAGRLREVRAGAFRSGNAFARHLGWVQSRVSKLETGTQLPTEDDIRDWVVGSAAGEDVEAELLELLAAARVEYSNARDVQRGDGLAARQASLAELESQTRRLCQYQPAVMPGLVQTAAYARELLGLPGGPLSHGAAETDVELLVAERIRRQAILYEPQRRIQLVIGEAALVQPARVGGDAARPARPPAGRGRPGERRARRPAAARTDAGAANGRLRPPRRRFVLVETLTAEQRLDEPGEVAVYRQAFERLLHATATGDEVVGRSSGRPCGPDHGPPDGAGGPLPPPTG